MVDKKNNYYTLISNNDYRCLTIVFKDLNQSQCVNKLPYALLINFKQYRWLKGSLKITFNLHLITYPHGTFKDFFNRKSAEIFHTVLNFTCKLCLQFSDVHGIPTNFLGNSPNI